MTTYKFKSVSFEKIRLYDARQYLYALIKVLYSFAEQFFFYGSILLLAHLGSISGAQQILRPPAIGCSLHGAFIQHFIILPVCIPGYCFNTVECSYSANNIKQFR